LPNYLISKDGTIAVIFGRIKPGLEKAPDAPLIMAAVRKMVADAEAGPLKGDHVMYISGGPAISNAFKEITEKDIQRLIPMALGLAALFLVILLRNVWGVMLPFLVVIGGVLSAFGIAGWFGLVQTSMSTVVPSILIAVGIADTLHILVTFFEELRRGRPRKEAAHYALTKNLLATFLTSLTTSIGFFSFVTAHLKPLGVLGIMAGTGGLVAWIVALFGVGGLLFVLPIKAKALPAERFQRTERRADGLVNMIARRRKLIIGITLGLSGVSLIISLGLEVNADPMKYFRSHSPVRVANEFLEKTMGNARSFELVVESGAEDGIKDPTFLKRVSELQQWLEKEPRVTRTISIVDILKSTHKSLNGDKPQSYALAENRETIAQELFLYTMGLPQGMDVNDRVSVKNDAVRITVLNSIVTSKEAMAKIHEIEERGRSMGLKVEATGKYYLYQSTNEYVVQSFLTSLWSATLLIGIIMSFFLRSVKLGLISMFPNIVPLFTGGVLLRVIGQPLDMGTVLVCSVCLGISIDDTSHVLANFATWTRQGVSPNEAMRRVMATTGPALLSTNGILISSFATFATATFMPNVYFGVLTAFILSWALLADMFFTPALLLESPEKETARMNGVRAA
jgi:uncharacterized protein